MRQKNLWILSGIPGSGKSTWAKNWIKTHGVGVIISRDAVRFALLEDEDDYFSRESEVYKEYIRWAQDKLNDDSCPGPVILDATHLDKRSRGKILNSLKLDNVDEIHVFYFNVPYDICVERNAQRTGRAFVPKSAINRMNLCLTKPTENEYPKKDFIVHTINKQGEEEWLSI